LIAILFQALPMSEANRLALLFAGLLAVGGAVISSLRLGRTLSPVDPAPEIVADAG
jgi:hypothetical protein